jgi:hypothetical protein
MKYRTLGRTGIKVSPYCLGAMMFGGIANADHDDCIRIIHKALDFGINFIDTADRYSNGEAEEIVGKALKGRRQNIVLATKVNGAMGDDSIQQGNSRRWVTQAVEASLRRLQTDYRPLPDPSALARHRYRGDAVGTYRPDSRGQGARHRFIDVPRLRDCGNGWRSAGAWFASAPSSRLIRSSTAASSTRFCPYARSMGWERWSGAAGEGPANRPLPQGADNAGKPACQIFSEADVRRSQSGSCRAAHSHRGASRALADAHGDGLCDGPPPA